jgi:D-alanyl-D-alanine carboxypeptidase
MESASHTASAAQTAAAAQVPDPFAQLALQAKAAYVLDLTDGRVLYQKNADERLPLASLTKVMTALAVSEVLDPAAVITIPYDTAYAGSPPTRLMAGQRLSVSDVMNFTLIASSNEGAEILADAADAGIHAKYPQSPADGATLWRMNDLARSLGLTETSFLNASGPDEALGQIPGLIMGKTGFTDLAGGNLATVFDVGLAHPVVAVVLGSTYDGRFSDMKALVAKTQEAIAR